MQIDGEGQKERNVEKGKSYKKGNREVEIGKD